MNGHKRNKVIWFAVLLAAVGTALGSESLTPKRAVALALEHHPVLAAADREVEGARADAGLARSGYLPRVDLTEDYMRSTNPVFVFASRLGQERFGLEDFALEALNQPEPLTNAATRVSLRQNVWDAGRTVLGIRLARAGREAVVDRRQRTREEVAFGALRAYWGAVLAGEMLEVARAGEKAARANLDLAAELVEAGMAVTSDRLSAEVRLAEVKSLRIQAEEGTQVARAALRQALGLSDDPDFALDPPALSPGGTAGNLEERVREAHTSRADLRSLDARLRQAEMGERIARSHRLPEVGLGAGYEWNDESPFGTEGSNWAVGASLRLPLFDGLETRARVGRARADRERLAAMRRALEEGIRLEVRAAWAQRAAASERLEVAERSLDRGAEALRIVHERYAEGMAVMVELLGAEAAHTAARGQRAEAAHDLALARAALDLASGREATVLGTVEEDRP